MKKQTEKNYLILSIIVLFIIFLIEIFIIFIKHNYSFSEIHFLNIRNSTKILYFFFIILPFLIFYLLIKNHYFIEKTYFFEYICHFTTYLLFGFPFLILSFLIDYLFNNKKKIKTIFIILLSLLSFIIIDFLLIFLSTVGYLLSVIILILISFLLNYIENEKFIYLSTIILSFYSIFIFSIHFLHSINGLKENYYFSFYLSTFIFLYLINILTIYYNLKSEIEKKKNIFLEKMLDFTFNESFYLDKEKYFLELSNFISNYIDFDLIYIGKSDKEMNNLNIIFAQEKGKIIKNQSIALKNTMSFLTLKTKNSFVYFEDISKIPNTMYARLEGSTIETKSFLGVPIKDKYKRNFALIGIEKEKKEKLKKSEIDIFLLFTKHIQFVLNKEK